MTLQGIRDLLLTTELPVHHYFAENRAESYIVWAEDSETESIYADNKKEEQITQGTIDFFTKQEYDQNVKKIQNTLTENEITLELLSVQYEEDTGYIHYEWSFDVEDAYG